jgi:hypothetical protein
MVTGTYQVPARRSHVRSHVEAGKLDAPDAMTRPTGIVIDKNPGG